MKAFISLLYVVIVFTGLSAFARESLLTAYVPADAIVFIATPDLTEFDSQWSATSFAHLWQSEDFADFRKAFHEATRISSGSEVSLLGISWQQLLNIASGEACWALAPLGDDVGFLLLVDVSGHKDEATQLVAELRAQATSRTYFLEEGILGITNRQEFSIAPSESLASNEQFATVAEHSYSTAAMLTWYLKPWAFRSLAMRSGSEELGQTWQLLADNGFKVVQAIGGAMTLSTNESDVENQCFIYAPGERQKASRLLDFASLRDDPLPKWVPGEIDSVSRIQWNLAGALAGYGSYFDAAYAEEVEGTFDAVLDDILKEPTGPQVDVMALMGIQAGPVLRLSKTLDDGLTATVYAVRVSDEERMVDALQRMFGPDKGVEKKSAGPFELWVFKDAITDPDVGQPMGPDLANYSLATAHGYFFVATSEDALIALLEDNPSTKQFHSEELERQLKDHLAENTIRTHISPSAAGLRPIYEGLRKRGEVDLGQLLGDPESEQHVLNLAQLPNSNVLPNFIASGFGFVNQTEDGWLLQDFVGKEVK